MKNVLKSVLYMTLGFFSIYPLKAININCLTDARSYALGNLVSILPGFSQPASYSFESFRGVSLQYSNKYSLKELSLFSGIINMPNRYLNVGISVSRYGLDAYHETLCAINIYRRLSSRIGLGIRVNYFNLHYSVKESNSWAITTDIGLMVTPFDNFYTSLLIINPLQTGLKMSKEKENISSIFITGLCYKVNEQFLLTAEVEKGIKLPALYKVGFEYTPISQLSIRLGMFAAPFTPSFGVGIQVKPFKLDVAFSKHPVLGFHSCCGLSFAF